jgi:hypothetical protein
LRHDGWRILLSSQLSSLESNREWWLSFQLLWKLALVLVLRLLLSYTAAQLVLIASLLAVRLAGVLIWQPYRAQMHNREECAMSCLASLILICGGAFYSSGRDNISTGGENAPFAFVVCILISMLTIVAACTFKAWRDSREKRTTLEQGQDEGVGRDDLSMDLLLMESIGSGVTPADFRSTNYLPLADFDSQHA